MIDSYFIIKVMNSFYQVKFFESAKIFDTFYSNFFKKKAFKNSLFKQINELASSMIINDEKKWKANDILNAQKHYRQIQFLIKWKEHDENKNWYNFDRFHNAIDIVKDFYKRYFDRLKSDWLKQQLNLKIRWFKEKSNVTNISFILKPEEIDVRLRHRKIDVISCYRKIFASSICNETSKWWKESRIMNARCDEEKTFWSINTP